jgi:hypothetical protein
MTLCGCNSTEPKSSRLATPVNIPPENEWNPSRLEEVSYRWSRYGIKISFYRSGHDQSWTMTVRDSSDVLERGEDTVWDLKQSCCSLEESLQVINQALSKFFSEKPDARIESMGLEMQLVRELWKEILTDVRATLSGLEGRKNVSRVDSPGEVGNAINAMLRKSPNIAPIKSLLSSHGAIADGVFQSTVIVFKDSLQGREWPDIAVLPGAGISFPGMIEFAFEKSNP